MPESNAVIYIIYNTMKLYLFKTSLYEGADRNKLAALLDSEKKIVHWNLSDEEKFTALSLLCFELTEPEFIAWMWDKGFACERWSPDFEILSEPGAAVIKQLKKIHSAHHRKTIKTPNRKLVTV